MLSDSFSRMIWLSSGIGAAAGAVGMYLSFQLEIPSGTTIVLANALVFVVALAATRGSGLRGAPSLEHPEELPVAAIAPGAR